MTKINLLPGIDGRTLYSIPDSGKICTGCGKRLIADLTEAERLSIMRDCEAERRTR